MSNPGIVYRANKQSKTYLLGKEEYDELSIATSIDRAQLRIEEKYQIVLENYQELEEELLKVSLILTLYTKNPWKEIDNAKLQFDRRILNFLSSARMYLDQIPSQLRKATRFPDDVINKFEQFTAFQYDTKLAYRVCEALRNYTQHRDLPVHGFSFGMRREPENLKDVIISYTELKLTLSVLESDDSFKKTTLEELRSLGDKYDLKNYLRDYMNSLGTIHISVRQELAGEAQWAIDKIKQIRNTIYSLPNAQSEHDIFLVLIEEDGQYRITFSLNTSRSERRISLQNNSRFPPKMVQIQVSSE